MKLFIGKLVLLLFSLILLNWVMAIALPSYWGNDVIYSKFKLLDLEPNVTTIFLGSSRIHCHIDPIQFDQKSTASHSFNLGCPGSTGAETSRIIDELIRNSEDHEIRTIYVEVPEFVVPPIENASSVRGCYFFGFKEAIYSKKYHSSFPSDPKKKIHDLTMSIRLIVSNAIGIHSFKVKLNRLCSHFMEQKNQVALRNRGFSPIRKSNKDPKGLALRLNQAKRFYNKEINGPKVENQFLTNYLLTKIDQAKQKDIDIVYVLMPKKPFQHYKTKYWSIEKIPDKHQLNLSDPNKFPRFYSNQLSSDKAHLNSKGAKEITNLFVKHYNEHFSNAKHRPASKTESK